MLLWPVLLPPSNDFPYFLILGIFISQIPIISSFILSSLFSFYFHLYACKACFPVYIGMAALISLLHWLGGGETGFVHTDEVPQLQNCDFYSICCSFLKPFPIIIPSVWFRVLRFFLFQPTLLVIALIFGKTALLKNQVYPLYN